MVIIKGGYFKIIDFRMARIKNGTYMSHIIEMSFNILKWLMIIEWDRKAPSGTFLSQLIVGMDLEVNHNRW